jgi:hypothetical protein
MWYSCETAMHCKKKYIPQNMKVNKYIILYFFRVSYEDTEKKQRRGIYFGINALEMLLFLTAIYNKTANSCPM